MTNREIAEKIAREWWSWPPGVDLPSALRRLCASITAALDAQRKDTERLEFYFEHAPGWLARQGHWLLGEHRWAWARYYGLVPDAEAQNRLHQPVTKYDSYRAAIDAELERRAREGDDYPSDAESWEYCAATSKEKP